jgi:hypothetical protein
MTLPRRLVDDPSAAPWLAERLRTAAAPSPMSPEAHARTGARLAARMSARRTGYAHPPWLLVAGVAAALALAVGAQLVPRSDGRSAAPSEPLRPEPRLATAGTAAPKARAGAGSLDATALEPAESSPQAPPMPAPPTTRAAGHRIETKGRPAPPSSSAPPRTTDASPAWLREARAALATDPERTLELIRTNRDRGVAVSPELLDVTARAVEARQALHGADTTRDAVRTQPSSGATGSPSTAP